jgi:protein-arginine kinase activator protein McsA
MNMVAYAERVFMGNIKVCPDCGESFNVFNSYRQRWCSRDCYLSALDEHLERKWEADMEGRAIEDDPREDR